MKILDFDSRVFLAPMAGITDKPLRRLTASFGGGVMVSEMVAVNSLSRRNPKSYRIADVRDENYPVVVQLVGADPEIFARAVELISELGAHSIDINMGCPVKKIVANKSGSYLMKDLPLAAEIIKTAIRSTTLPVSVKFRTGWDHNSINAVDFARMCEDCGASYLTVHGRTRSDFYSGNADWKQIAAVKAAVNIPVIGNGDVTSPQRAGEMLEQTGVDAVMIGRAALGAPWLIAQTHAFLEQGTDPGPVPVTLVKQALLTHIKGLVEYYGEKIALGLSRKYVCWYCKNFRDARRFRENYVRINNFPDAYAEINRYFDSCANQQED